MKSWDLRPRLKSAVLLFSAAVVIWAASPARAQTTVTPSIANGAKSVALDVPMKFTFSKAMDTTQTSATFVESQPSPGPVDVTDSWSAGNTVLTCSPMAGTWPATATITWLLDATDIDGVMVTVPPGIPPYGTFTTGSGSSSGDTNPPALLSSSPTNNATGVPRNHPVSFTFSESMQATQSIAWSGNLTPANFRYLWSADSTTLTCDYIGDLPGNATVTWKLNPSGATALFKDTAGNALPANVSGSFTTSNTNDPCITEPVDPSQGEFLMSRQVSYVQTGTGVPTEDTDTNNWPLFGAFLTSPANNPVTSAQLAIPSGSPLTLANISGRVFLSFDQYASQAQLDTNRPPGTYTLQVNRTTGGPQSAALTTKASDWPPIPQILNLAALQNADAASDVVVQWNGFANAGEEDGIQFLIDLGNNRFFEAPDLCVPIPLDKTATSITVPKGTLASGKTYDATLTYTHFGPSNTNNILDIPAFASASKALNFKIVTRSGVVPPKSPTIGGLSPTSQGLQAQITGAAANQSIQVQESTTVQPGSWTTMQTIQADASGNASFVFPVAPGQEFFRLYTP